MKRTTHTCDHVVCVWGQTALYRCEATQLATVRTHFPPSIEVTGRGCGMRRAACGMWCAFNLVSGQSTLIFIYSTYTHTHTLRSSHRHRHLFGFFVHTQDQPVCSTSISACVRVCVCVYFMQNPYSICQLNICANIKYWLQILACLAARSPVQSSSVHSPLDMLECCCFYIKLQLCLTLCTCDFICPTAAHTHTHTHTMYVYFCS